jgi:hypothetical protein
MASTDTCATAPGEQSRATIDSTSEQSRNTFDVRPLSNGDYALTNDGRFYSKMDFPRRSKHFRTLRTEIVIREMDSGFDLDFSIEESEAPFTIELCFRKGGTLAGVVPSSDADGYLLVEGFGSYTAGDDCIEFGPGNGSDARQSAIMDPGEYYTYLVGRLVPDGVRVYVTGRSPIRYVLKLRTPAASA